MLSATFFVPHGVLLTVPSAVQWAYLFERFPSFTQTFCYREVAEIMRQGLAPWIYSIRRPRDEPGQDFPAEFAGRVRYVPEEGDLFTEFRWLIRTQHLHPLLQEVALGLKGTHDYGRIQEAGWLGGQMQAAGIGHVHAHFAGLAARTAYWLQRYYGIGYSFTAHANDIFSPNDPALPVRLEDLIRRAKFVVTVSDFSASQLKARFPWASRKIYRIYNGIDTSAFIPARFPAPARSRIVSVGRYIEKKGFADLITACGILRARGLPFECSIVGEGPLEDELAADIRRANLSDHVMLTGPKSMSEVTEFLASSHVFALPCVEEADGGMDNLPTVIAEAMAAGLPVVSTMLAGIPEMVVDGRTGLLVLPHTPEKLADALERLIINPGLARRMGSRGRRQARKVFETKATTRQLKRLMLTQTTVNIEKEAMRQDMYLRWLDWQRRRKAKALAAVARSLAPAPG